LPTAKQLAPGTPPTNAPTVITSGGATVTYGSTLTAGDATDTIIVGGTGKNTILNAEGRNVVFSGGKATGTTITLQGNDTIIADPPVGAVTSAASTSASPVVSAAAYTPVSASAITTSSTAPTSASASINAASDFTTAGLSNLAAFNAASIISAAPTVTQTRLIDSDNQTASASPVASVGQSRTLSGGVSNVAERRMDRGVLLLSPESNTRVKCGDATVDVAANSVALLVAFDGGVAVYNLHDTTRGAVAVAQGDHRLAIQPGRSLVITNRKVDYFEDVNPAEFVGYRRVAAKAYDDGIRTFQSEYNLFSLMQGLPPLKTMVASKDSRDKKAVASMMKTAAILLSTNDAMPFERMQPRRITAMVQGLSH
jgi:urease gamma subunit